MAGADRLGKLCGGPAWDFDQALSNSTFNEGPNYSEWIITKSEWDGWLAENHPPFWRKLFNERKFKLKLAKRWFALRTDVWSTATIMEFINNTAAYLNEAQQRNFTKWPILGQEIWRSTPGWAQRDTYQKEVSYLKAFLQNRLAWMDAQLQPVFDEANKPVELEKGLVGYYQLDEGSGNLANNSVRGVNVSPNGQLINNPEWVAGKEGSALRFDSQKNGYVNLGFYDPSQGADALSISCWIYWDGVDGNWQGMCAKRTSWDPADIHWSIILDNNSGGIQFETNTADQGKVYVISPAPSVRKWVHMALVYSASQARFYLDGNSVAEGYMVLGENRNAAFLVGCGEPNGTVAFSGIIDELRFYNRALNANEVAVLSGTNDLDHDIDNHPEISEFQLFQNYPNPFNNSTMFHYQLPVASNVLLRIHNILGQTVTTLVSEKQEAGYYTVIWDANHFTSGIYFCQLTADAFQQVKKLILVR
jgi:hypothetical protein